MKRFAALLLAVVLVFSMCACTTAGAGNETEETKDIYQYPEIREKLSWEKINSFPVKSSDMTVEEMRTLCVDFFRYTKTALWTPDESFTYIRNSEGTQDQMYQGVVYGGLPYIGVASGNIYRLMDYMDEQTGVVDMSEATVEPKLFGNQCSIGAYWGWGRVINSADYDWTANMVQQNGFLRVGPYTYNDSLPSFRQAENTGTICAQNGAMRMFESYAQLQPADGLVNYSTAGHVMMCSSAPVVVYNDDGTVNGVESYITIIDQHQGWSEATNASGDVYQYKNYVDRKFTFYQLFEASYIPFTFAEFLGTDPVEETQCSFSHTDSSITVSSLLSAVVTANYGISDVYAIVKDRDGNQVISCVGRAEKAGVLKLGFSGAFQAADWEQYANGEHTVEVICQLATGERPVVYTGTLVK